MLSVTKNNIVIFGVKGYKTSGQIIDRFHYKVAYHLLFIFFTATAMRWSEIPIINIAKCIPIHIIINTEIYLYGYL